MATAETDSLAEEILHLVGGDENVVKSTHCATRLRLTLADDTRADTETLKEVSGVLAVVQAGGQYQIVVGNEVAEIHRALTAHRPAGAALQDDAEDGPRSSGTMARKNILDRFIDLISSIIQPIVWTLAATGLLKAFLTMAAEFGWADVDGGTYILLDAAADALFYFLPIFLAVTSARRFGADEFTSMAIAGALIYPSILDRAGEGSTSFAGIPVLLMDYTYSLIPVVLAVWMQSYLERLLNRVLPALIRSFARPLLTVAIMVPLVLMTVGPATIHSSSLLADGLNHMFEVVPWLAGAFLGATDQILVIFGLHWGLTPIMLNDLGTQGYSQIMGPPVAAVFAQVAATAAVFVRTRSQARRRVAGPAAFTGFMAGVTEPAIYGVNLPLKRPFYFGMIGGAIGGSIIATGGTAATSYVFYSVLSLPAYSSVGSFSLFLVGLAVAALVAFALTFCFCPREEESSAAELSESDASRDYEQQPGAEGAPALRLDEAAGHAEVLAPASGQLLALGSVSDTAFASGALGAGVAILPEDGRICAPVSGTLHAVMSSGHAYGIKTDDGIEVLVHVGIDTVKLAGKGFSPMVERDARVEAGDLLAEVDLKVLDEAGYEATTLVVVTNSDDYPQVVPAEPGPIHGGAPVLTVKEN